MSKEIAELRGRLAAAEKLLEGLSLSIDCTIDELRCLADKYEEKSLLANDKIFYLAKRLDIDVRDYRDTSSLCRSLSKDLGEA